MSRRLRRSLLLVVACLAVAAWVAFLYALTWHAYGSHSDSANAARAGHDLVAGNPLLRGWTLPADSYWSIDLPVFGLLSVVFGLRPGIVHLAPLLIAVAAIAVAAVAVAGRPGRSGGPGPSMAGRSVAAGLVAVVLLLGLPHAFLAYIFFQGPWHVGTAALCLASFLLAGAPLRTGRWAAAMVLLTAAVVGDPLAVALGVAPVVGASALRALRNRRAGDAGHAVASGLVPVAAAVAVRLLLSAAGGFHPATTETSPASNVLTNLRHIPRLLGALLGVGPLAGLSGGGRVGAGLLDGAAHVLGAILVAGAVAGTTAALILRTVLGRGLRRRPADPAEPSAEAREVWLDDALVLGFWASIAAYAVVAAPGAGYAGARYLPPALLFGVTLAGRRLRSLPAAPPVLRRGGAVLLGVLLPFYLVGSVRLLDRAEPKDPDAALAGTLLARRLSFGYAPYWIASNTVLQSRGRLTIVPVESLGGRLRPFDFYAERSGLRLPPPPSKPTFVVFRADTGWGNVDIPSARVSFGEPAAVETIGPYTLLTWGPADHER